MNLDPALGDETFHGGLSARGWNELLEQSHERIRFDPPVVFYPYPAPPRSKS